MDWGSSETNIMSKIPRFDSTLQHIAAKHIDAVPVGLFKIYQY